MTNAHTHIRTYAQTHKRINTLKALGFAVTATILWTACQKEMVPAPGVTSVAQDLTPRIAKFVTKAEHQAGVQGNPRSTNEFNADSAAWYIEGALNYSLAQAWLPYNEIVSDSITISIAGTANAVNVSDAANVYLTLLGQIGHAATGPRHLIVVDAEPHTTEAGMELRVRYAMGQGNERLGLNTTYPANTMLWFMSGIGSNGSCDPNVVSPKAADKTIQDRVGVTIPHLAIGENYASVETWYVNLYGDTDPSLRRYRNEYFQTTGNTSGHSNQDYKIYFCEDGNCSLCLDAGDMTAHTQGTYDVMQWIKQQHCPGKAPASISVQGDFPLGSGAYFHAVKYTYGIPQSQLSL